MKEYTAFTRELAILNSDVGKKASKSAIKIGDEDAECEVTKDLSIKYPVRFIMQRDPHTCRLNLPEVANATDICRSDIGIPDDLLNAVQCRWDPLSVEIEPISTSDAVSQLLSEDHKPLSRNTVHHDLIQIDEVDSISELRPSLQTVRANLTALMRITVWTGPCG